MVAAFALVVVVGTPEDEAVGIVRHHIVDKDTLWPQPCQCPADFCCSEFGLRQGYRMRSASRKLHDCANGWSPGLNMLKRRRCIVSELLAVESTREHHSSTEINKTYMIAPISNAVGNSITSLTPDLSLNQPSHLSVLGDDAWTTKAAVIWKSRHGCCTAWLLSDKAQHRLRRGELNERARAECAVTPCSSKMK